ncbi:hypothetical protein [Streptomyces sp. SID3343]|uniref:hypothetical protein n=1 Tax=Streptomyces sp. SID3343 TaxID=2690260 RepID=UPI0013702070|nr:hypothetical protein [Streptomyces sp. SID3343]MYV98036.1 hypothetical protein [Streptomyces sp. SID3343]
MSIPDTKQLLHWADQYVALWNSGDKEAWSANWRAVAPGDFRMLDPVGTPEKQGFEHCALDSWDLFQPTVRFRIQPGTLFVCGNEVAWVMENHFTDNGVEGNVVSIETYRFEADGSVVIRTYYRVPDHQDGAMGEIFQTYLP